MKGEEPALQSEQTVSDIAKEKYPEFWNELGFFQKAMIRKIAQEYSKVYSKDLLEACMEFVRKVECGEAKSKRSYAQMKLAITKATGESKG